MKLTITTSGDGITVAFDDVRMGRVVEAHGTTLMDAIERSISHFKDLQDAAVAELRLWGFIRLPEHAVSEGNAS